MAIASINPATGETVKTYDEMPEADVERCLAAAAAAAASYRLTGFDQRAGWMRRAADILDEEQDQIAAMMTAEMGKTLAASRQEVAKCAATCRYSSSCSVSSASRARPSASVRRARSTSMSATASAVSASTMTRSSATCRNPPPTA